jgi:hypothetical protein
MDTGRAVAAAVRAPGAIPDLELQTMSIRVEVVSGWADRALAMD